MQNLVFSGFFVFTFTALFFADAAVLKTISATIEFELSKHSNDQQAPVETHQGDIVEILVPPLDVFGNKRSPQESILTSVEFNSEKPRLYFTDSEDTLLDSGEFIWKNNDETFLDDPFTFSKSTFITDSKGALSTMHKQIIKHAEKATLRCNKTEGFHLVGVSCSGSCFFSQMGIQMDLKRVKNEDKLDLCRKYYLGGFAFLPFLWIVNSIWFFKEAFIKPHYEQQTQIKTYVIRSIIGSILWVAVIVTWVTIFQLKRAEWGATADYMSFIIPRGEK